MVGCPILRLIVVFFATTIICRCISQVIVTTKYGDILGQTRRYPNFDKTPFKSVHRFLGVPFASPPVGRLRFRPPIPPSAWKPRILNATRYGKFCRQPRIDENEKYMKKFLIELSAKDYSEDCLVLNIFTPKINKNMNSQEKFLPVMFNIHGGGYEVGTSLFAPGDMLALQGVVVVTTQYRLSTFGFATTGNDDAPGNYGMLDQVEALKWVKENIGKFGGNSSHITIFGESAGGASVCLHMLSPLSRGLFHQAMAMSGVDLSHFAFAPLEKVVQYTKTVAKRVGCPTDDSFSMMECMRKVQSSAIPVDGIDSWRPVADGNFLRASPSELRMRGDFLKIPFIAGFTKNDGAAFTSGKPVTNQAQFREAINQTFKTISNYQSGIPGTESLQSLILDAVVFRYTPRPLTSNPLAWKQKVFDIVTDFVFAAPTHKVLLSHTQFAPGYLYVFEHTSKLFNTKWTSMKHLDDYPFWFGYPLLNLTRYEYVQPGFDNADKQFSALLITFLTNFAKYGIPTPSPARGVQWEKFNGSDRKYLALRVQPVMTRNFRPQNMDFWNSYYLKLLKAPQGERKVCAASSLSNKTLNLGIIVFINALTVATLFNF